jgi:subfamily B ATP-binding cassette protein MsbA
MLKDSFVFALDEATASLDQASERTIKKALKALQFNKTIIMVTHRLSMLTDVDMIYVLKDGSLYESGTHSDLMRKKDEYYRLSTQTLKVNT